MNAVFVETSGWMACADRADPAQVACTAVRDAPLEAGRILITTDFVVDEPLTLIRFRLGLAAAKGMVAADRRKRPAAMGARRQRSFRTGAEPLFSVSRQGPFIHRL